MKSLHKSPCSFLLSCAFCFALLCSSAAAEINAQASLSRLGWILFDLDPLDGREASISFYPTSGLNKALAVSETGDDSNFEETSFVPGNASAFAPLGQGRASVASVISSSSFASLELRAFGNARTFNSEDLSSFYAEAKSNDWSFVVSPNTIVSFYADAYIAADVTGLGFEYTFAQTRLSVSNFSSDVDPNTVGTNYQNSIASEAFVFDSLVPASRSSNSTLRVAFINGTSNEMTGYVSAIAFSSGLSTVAAVPEPEAWMLLSVGLVVIFFGRRRVRI